MHPEPSALQIARERFLRRGMVVHYLMRRLRERIPDTILQAHADLRLRGLGHVLQ